MSSQEEIGKKIKKARQKADMTQADVAEKAGIHVNYFARIERGEENPSIEIIEKIAKALKVKSSEILPF
jgi:transcriptional regulator with XRE-family HTH domain